MNHLRYWGLRHKPFLFEQSDDFFAGIPQREALAGLNYFVGSQDSLAMVVCPRRNGLSWLLSHVQQMRGFGDHATEFVLTCGDLSDRRQIQANLCAAMGFETTIGDVDSLINRSLAALHQQEVRLVWLIDECHPVTAAIAQDIVGSNENFSVALGVTSSSERQTILQLEQHPLQIELLPLSLEETFRYVKFCVERADGKVSIIPDNTAVRLHELTGGVIGNLAIAAESSLALAAGHQLDQVTPAVVEAFAEQSRRAA